MIDLRSDTVTRPTAEMRRVMAEAEVGDDVLGDDPTVRRLEARVSDLLGKEAAVYMPSGTMTNQVAIRTWTEPGDEIILEADGHSYFYESGGPAALSGVTCRLIRGERGLFTADQVRAVLRPANEHFPRTRLVAVENTHNRGGGTVWPIDQVADVADAARQAGLKMHLDGARLWNAAVASGVTEAACASHFDSVSVCFSKGLGAPIGSALAGGVEFISRARRFRKMFGGGTRQAGIVAAGALYALDHHRRRLAEDHAGAKRLAEGIAPLDGIEIDPATVETNIVIFGVTAMPAAELVARLAAADVLVLARDAESIRAVTNLDVTADQIDETIEKFAAILAG
jgi:threonine aldolase